MESKAAQLTRGEHYLLWNRKVKTLCSLNLYFSRKASDFQWARADDREETQLEFKLGRSQRCAAWVAPDQPTGRELKHEPGCQFVQLQVWHPAV